MFRSTRPYPSEDPELNKPRAPIIPSFKVSIYILGGILLILIISILSSLKP